MEYVFKTDDDVVVGGVLGGINYWNGLEIKILWVKEGYRRHKLGQKLLSYIETTAKKKGASLSMLDTFDFQAEYFYLKNGYISIGKIKNFPNGHKRIYFSKEL